jgi:hypothetical protein
MVVDERREPGAPHGEAEHDLLEATCRDQGGEHRRIVGRPRASLPVSGLEYRSKLRFIVPVERAERDRDVLDLEPDDEVLKVDHGEPTIVDEHVAWGEIAVKHVRRMWWVTP